jgi:ribosomal protein S18 acetylase RimI-like enzyme
MPGPGSFTIAPARTDEDLASVAALFRAYAASLPVDLAYQGFEAEVTGLPGRYAPPEGALLLARDGNGLALGCVALRALGPPGSCEMKRLYVDPRGRGVGLGRALAEAVMAEAALPGYRDIRLDTLPGMAEAQALYRRLGFVPAEPYYDTPVAGTVFLQRPLP